MLDVFVCESVTVRALCEADSLAEGAVVGFGIGGVEGGNGVAAGDAYWHCRGGWEFTSCVFGREGIRGLVMEVVKCVECRGGVGTEREVVWM